MKLARPLSHDDARMIAFHIVSSAKAQEIPEYPLSEREERGTVGSQHIPYEFNHGRVTVEGHDFEMAELFGCLAKLEAMVEQARAQGDLFA